MTVFLGCWTLVSGLLVLNVFHPLVPRDFRSPTALVCCFALGWLVGDLALLFLLLDFGVLTLAFWAGELATISAVFWLLLHSALAVALLHRLYRLSGLSSGLQLQLESQGSPLTPFPQIADGGWDWLQNSLWPQQKEATARHTEVYASTGGHALTLDVYRPENLSPVQQPVLLHIHGGGWHVGTHNQGIPLLRHLAAQGWVCVAPTYRLAPQLKLPEAFADVQQALKWLVQHQRRLGIDPERIVISGGSAGGQLASLLALKLSRPETRPPGVTIVGCLSLYGVYDLHGCFAEETPNPARAKLLSSAMGATPSNRPERYEAMSPLHQVHPKAPPFLLVQGSKDALIPPEEPQAFQQRLRDAGASATLLQLPEVEHAFDLFPTRPTRQALPVLTAWLNALVTRSG